MDTQYATTPQAPNPGYSVTQPPVVVKQPSGWGKLCAAFGLAFAVLFIQGIAVLIGMTSRSDDAIMAVGEIAGGIAAILFVRALGGKLLSTPSMEGMREAWRVIKWIFIVDAVITVIDIISIIADGSFALAQLWPLRIIVLLLMCAGIGLFEEATFRGLIFHGLLARMGASTRGIFWAVVVSSFIFGLMHIDPTSMNWGDPLQVLQAVFKILQTGIFGFAAAAVVLKTGNLWPVALLHGLNDFMLMFVSNGLMSSPVVTEYVMEGTDGLVTVGVYIVLCAAYIPSLIAALRVLREHPAPDRGQFYRVHTYPQTVIAAPQVAYAAPQAAYVMPQAAYAMPQATYAPGAGYPVPQAAYAVPQPTYAPPQPVYMPDASGYAMQSQPTQETYPQYAQPQQPQQPQPLQPAQSAQPTYPTYPPAQPGQQDQNPQS